ncbi:MAG: cation:proton antiporter [Gemmatimonadetes bacterium]|nr:cation:proton antiporter [Gemmatimonadota bacterium]
MIDALLPLGLLIVVGKLFEGIFKRFGLNSIVAYTITGTLLGPITNIIELTSELQTFLGIGIFVFFFLVGLDEIDIPSFVATLRGRFFVAAIVSVLISLLVSIVFTSNLFEIGEFSLNLGFTEGLALAGILSLTSLGLVAKVLADKEHFKEPIGLEIFTTVIIAELLALLVVGFSIGEHEHELSVASVLFLLVQMTIFAIVAWFLSTRLLPPVIIFLQRFLNVPELSFGLIIGGLFLMVVGAEKIHLHGSIGALLFGAALSGLPRQVHQDVLPGLRSAAEGLFVPLFFASAGLHLDLSFTTLPIATIVALVVFPSLGKFAGAFIGTYIARLDNPLAQSTGLMAKGVAEIALLLILFESGVIGQDIFSLFVLMMFGYIILMPSAIDFAITKAKKTHRPKLPDSVPLSFARHTMQNITTNHVIDSTRTYPNSALSAKNFIDSWLVPNQQDYLVVDEDNVKGAISLPRLQAMSSRLRANLSLNTVLRTNLPQAHLDEPIEDVLKRMTKHSLSVIPVTDRDSGKFLGSITSENILQLAVLMDEIAEELEKRGEDKP